MKFQEFVKGVNAFEEENWFGEYVYFKTIEKLSGVQADALSLRPADVKDVIRMFLLQWGQMARTINRKGTEWDKLCNNITGRAKAFRRLQNIEILTFGQSDEQYVAELYNAIHVKNIGATSISKILHVLNPKLFVPWDVEIRLNTREGLGYRNAGQLGKPFSESASGYVAFLRSARDEVKGALLEKAKTPADISTVVGEILSERLEVQGGRLEQEYKWMKTLAKLIDEYNWYCAWK